MTCITVPSAAADSILDAKIVALIQTQLATLSWVEKCFGIAQVAEMKTADGGIERFPRIMAQSTTGVKEYIDIRYDDSLKAQIFFERDGEITIGEDDEFDQVSYPLSLVCWANMNKVDSGRAYDFTDMLAGDVIRILRYNFESNISDRMNIELRAENVYSKYTLSDAENKFITAPYTAFRISFVWTEFQSGACYTFTPIANSPC